MTPIMSLVLAPSSLSAFSASVQHTRLGGAGASRPIDALGPRPGSPPRKTVAGDAVPSAKPPGVLRRGSVLDIVV